MKKNVPSADTYSVPVGWSDYRVRAYPDGTVIDVHVRSIDERSWMPVTGPMRDAVVKEWKKRRETKA